MINVRSLNEFERLFQTFPLREMFLFSACVDNQTYEKGYKTQQKIPKQSLFSPTLVEDVLNK